MEQQQTTILNYQSNFALNPYEDVISRDRIYTDFDLRMITHPINGSLSILEDIDAVKRALINLILTEPGERPFDPNYGTPLGAMLFNFMELNPFDVEDQIKRSIDLYEPRVKVTNVRLIDERDSNTIGVIIEFRVINVESEETYSIQLKRLR